MYVILTSKPGQFRTEPGEGLRPVESCDFMFFGLCKARFVIAEIDESSTVKPSITITDETPPMVVNRIPSKFLPKFDTVDKALAELRVLVRVGDEHVSLIRTSI
jgi:hypothetical protein